MAIYLFNVKTFALFCFPFRLVSHLLKRILCGPEREHLLERFSLSVHENTSVDSQCIFVATGIIACPCRYNGNASVRCLGNSLPMYALLCECVYNCNLDNHIENLITEPLSRKWTVALIRIFQLSAACHNMKSTSLEVTSLCTFKFSSSVILV
jgi:hypothetical protein